ncbi:DUF5752 family protein [Acidihalobacter prosperus]
MANRPPNKHKPEARGFAIKDCALVAMATGKRINQVQEFRREVAVIDASSIYHHFWGGLLQPRFGEREYNNDFAAWMQHGIHDAILAERLSVLDPTRFADIEALRQEIIDLIDARLDEAEHLFWARPTQPFVFVRSQIVVFDTQKLLRHPSELASIIENLSVSSIFYHFIDARRRPPEITDDFSNWLLAFGSEYSPLCEKLSSLDPYFSSLGELCDRLAKLVMAHFQGATA